MLCPYLAIRTLVAGLSGNRIVNELDWNAPRDFDWALQTLVPPVACLLIASAISHEGSMQAFKSGKAYGQAPPLLDVVHQSVGHFDHTDMSDPLFRAPDLLLLVGCFPMFCFTLWSVWRKSFAALILLVKKVCFLYSTLVVLRTATVISTTLPSPLGSCQNHSLLSEFPPQDGTVFSTIYCNDQLFSGHTMTNTFVFLLVWFSDLRIVIRLAFALFIVVSISVSVVTRDHYTVDAVVAVIITTLLLWLHKGSLSLLLRGAIPASTSGSVEWELYDEKDRVKVVLRGGEIRFLGRRDFEHPTQPLKFSRKHLLVQVCEDCLVCENVGRRSLKVTTTEPSETAIIGPSCTFKWSEGAKCSIDGTTTSFSISRIE